MRFAIIGVAGFVAPRHLKAIYETGNVLVAATDPNDSVGILDRYSFDTKYFREIERFDRHLDKLRRGAGDERIDWVSICSPNYLHDAHIRLALRNGANALCEKPLVINPWNLDALEDLEIETGKRVCTVLQLRVHPVLLALKEKLALEPRRSCDVVLTYVTARGAWYHVSWKGSEDRSGGVAMNIGIHFFDLLIWLFGPVLGVEVHCKDRGRMLGYLEMSRARVRWCLSVDRADLPRHPEPQGASTFRSLTIDGDEIEFTEGFADLHTKIYEEMLAGRGFGIAHTRPAIELVHRLRSATVSVPTPETSHPAVAASTLVC